MTASAVYLGSALLTIIFYLVEEQQLSSRAVKRKTKEQVPITDVILNEKTSVLRKGGLLKLMYSTPQQLAAVRYANCNHSFMGL